jgi:hypothetical protein
VTSVKVYKYQWTYWDFLKDIEERCISEACATSKHIKKKANKHPERHYAIIPDSVRTVGKMQVVHGIFNPDLRSAPEDPRESELD